MAQADEVVVIGAGIGGLAAALRLAHAGRAVTVIEGHDAPGGKMRTVPSAAGPVDAGPTVLTLLPVFEALFEEAGERIEDHVTLHPLATLARHRWSDGTALDLAADPEASAVAVRAAFGARAEREFRAFGAEAARLFEAFDRPVMRAPTPSLGAVAGLVARRPALLRAMDPGRTLAGHLARRFSEPKLAQLFGRYATYVGGSPYAVPALIGLIWEAEARGVWRVEGGMHRLACAIEALARARGAAFRYGARAERIEWRGGRPVAVHVSGERHPASTVLFNGDPNALRMGALGEEARDAVPARAVEPRSLSACVASFAARARGPALAHHTVFFGDDPRAEFAALARGRLPQSPTLYVCAQDCDAPPGAPGRFEIIMNAPPLGAGGGPEEERDRCLTLITDTLARFGLTFDPPPGAESLTTPRGFEALCPHSEGSLYGRSPQGTMAAFARPRARTACKGLYLAGGGAHPGAGLPMAALSGRHAAEAILSDRTSTSRSRPRATAGGTSTASARTARAPSRSSLS